MAKDSDDIWRRRREREDEEEAEKLEIESKKLGIKSTPETDQKLEGLTHQAEVLIEQVDRLYTLYFQGMEKLPPIQKRKILDDMMDQIDREAKPTAQQRFKAQSARTKYSTYKDRWDKKLKDLESGKLRRG